MGLPERRDDRLECGCLWWDASWRIFQARAAEDAEDRGTPPALSPDRAATADATIGTVSREDLDDFIEESRARQRNVVFPDTVRNGVLVDVFLWRGSPNPTLVQRITACLFGLVFIGSGASLMTWVGGIRDAGEWLVAFFLTAVCLAAIAVGIKMIRNGFSRRPKPKA